MGLWVWDLTPELTITSPHRLQSRPQHKYHGQPYARVDLNPMPDSTLSLHSGTKNLASVFCTMRNTSEKLPMTTSENIVPTRKDIEIKLFRKDVQRVSSNIQIIFLLIYHWLISLNSEKYNDDNTKSSCAAVLKNIALNVLCAIDSISLNKNLVKNCFGKVRCKINVPRRVISPR
jgi:hypothetical protein